MADFNKIGLITVQKDAFLLCRKNHFTSKLILPGGRIEKDEDSMACLTRELHEELGEVSAIHIHYIGTYQDIAHSDDPSIIKTLEIKLFSGDLTGTPRPCSEIIELVWFNKESNIEELTPILKNKILPDLIRKKILNW